MPSAIHEMANLNGNCPSENNLSGSPRMGIWCRILIADGFFANVRPEASHLGSRQRHSSNVVSDVSVASVAQPRANGNEPGVLRGSALWKCGLGGTRSSFLTREVVRTKPHRAQSASTVVTTLIAASPENL